MALSESTFQYNNLGKITSNGVEVATFPQIRNAIAARMREIYGEDIDLSTASADGQYINMESLILNNVYTTLMFLQNSINPNTASGKYLDILCSLTNVHRKPSSRSIANVYVKYIGSELNHKPEKIVVLDTNGIEWQWINPLDLNNEPTIYFNTGDILILEFLPIESDGSTYGIPLYGSIEANGAHPGTTISDPTTDIDWDNLSADHGDIYQTISFGEFLIYQNDNAEPGNDEEDDSSLRARRSSFLGANSTTTQAGLEAALFNLPQIEDVYIMNNVSGNDAEAPDEVTVGNHNVYVVIRYKEGLTVPDRTIAETIYQKLTPGVVTETAANSYDINLASGVSTTIYWKVATPIHPTVVINFTYTKDYIKYIGEDTQTEFTKSEQAIVDALQNYFNKVGLNEKVLSSSIQSAFFGADPRYNGQNTYFPTGCTIGGASIRDASLNYFKYLGGYGEDYTFNYNIDGETATLTISHSD